MGLLGVLFIIGAINIYNSFKVIEPDDMSQRLTDAITTNNAAALQEFAEEHDSVRAYMPYALLCYNNGDYEIAEKFANDSLKVIIRHKKDSVESLVEQNVQEHKNDSLFNEAKIRYKNGKLEEARIILENVGSGYLSKQEVKSLLSKIDSTLEVRQKEMLKKQKEQQDHMQKKELERLKREQEQAYADGIRLYNEWSKHRNLGDESDGKIEERRVAAIKRLKEADPSKVQSLLNNLNKNK